MTRIDWWKVEDYCGDILLAIFLFPITLVAFVCMIAGILCSRRKKGENQ